MDAAVSVELFVEILNRYVYYFDQENEAVRIRIYPAASHPWPLPWPVHVLTANQVTIKFLNGLIELIHSNLQSNDAASSLENPRRHFQRTLDYIASREYEGVVTAPK